MECRNSILKHAARTAQFSFHGANCTDIVLRMPRLLAFSQIRSGDRPGTVPSHTLGGKTS